MIKIKFYKFIVVFISVSLFFSSSTYGEWENLSPVPGEDENYENMLMQMQQRYDIHNDQEIDPFIREHVDRIYSISGTIDPVLDFGDALVAIREVFNKAIMQIGAENIVHRLEKELGVQLQILVIRDGEKFPISAGKEVRGHASSKYITVLVREDELDNIYFIVGKLFHEIRARSSLMNRLFTQNNPQSIQEADLLLGEFEQANQEIERQINSSGHISDPELAKEFANLTFDKELSVNLRDYTATKNGTGDLESNMGVLKHVRSILESLPSESIFVANKKARILALLDFITNSVIQEESALPPSIIKEYKDTISWLEQEHSDLRQVIQIKLISKGSANDIFNFYIKTAADNGTYIFSIVTQDTTNFPKTKINGITKNGRYRLEEIFTGVSFPWEPPHSYIGSFLRGETDRFGHTISGNDPSAWAVIPGTQKGSFQLMQVIQEDNGQINWDSISQEPTYGAEADSIQFQRSAGAQQHNFIKNSKQKVACDIVTGHQRTKGAVTIVAFPNGNAGVGFVDSNSTTPFVVDEIQSIENETTKRRGVSLHVKSSSSEAVFSQNNIVLDTVRHIRDWTSLEGDWQRVGELDEFVHRVHSLPLDVSIALSREGISLDEMLLQSKPVFRLQKRKEDQRLYILRYTISGHLYIVEMVFPKDYKIDLNADGIRIMSDDGKPLEWKMRVTTDFPPLTPIKPEALFKQDVLMQAQGSDDLKRTLEDVEFLAFEEFFAAGSHRFLQYFGRDTLIWLHLFAPLLTNSAHSTAIQGIIDRISLQYPKGRLPSVEEVYDEVARELIQEFCQACRKASSTGDYREVQSIARELYSLKTKSASRLKYGVPDVNLMFLPILLEYLERTDITEKEKKEFIEAKGSQQIQNLIVCLCNINLVMSHARDYMDAVAAKKPVHEGLVPIERGGFIGNWRDVQYGIGYGQYPADVNLELLPTAFQTAATIIEKIRSLYPNRAEIIELIDRIVTQQGLTELQRFLQDEKKIARETENAFSVLRNSTTPVLSAEDIRSRLHRYFTMNRSMTAVEHEWFLRRDLGSGVKVRDFVKPDGPVPAILQRGVRYFPASLSADGKPVELFVSDALYKFLNENLAEWELLEMLTPLLLPYPVGLWTPAGFVVASPVLSNNETLVREVNRNAYGGCVMYGWQMEFLKQGLIQYLLRYKDALPESVDKDFLGVLYSILLSCEEATSQNSRQELWTWHIDNAGQFHSVPFGSSPEHNDESNIIQLWSISCTQTFMADINNMAQRFGLQRLAMPQVLDAISKLQTTYTAPAVNAIEPASLPRVAMISYSLPPGGGGVNVVVNDQTGMLRMFDYPVTLIGGQVLSGEAGKVTLESAGTKVILIPEVDVRSEQEQRAWSGINKEDPYFRKEIESLKDRLRESIKDADVVLVHQMMSMPANPVATIALAELATEYRGKKRFIGWVHNTLTQQIHSWPFSTITSCHPDIEYVAVSPQLRDATANLFYVPRELISVIPNSTGAVKFMSLTQNVLSFYLDHRLYDAEMIWFYPTRLERTKKLEVAIRAAAKARDMGKDIKLVIATVPDSTGALPTQGPAGQYLRELTDLINSLNMADRVIFYPHASGDMKEISNWYTLSDALIFPSQTETFGIPVVEAGLSGTLFARVKLPETDALVGEFDQIAIPKQEHWENDDQYANKFSQALVGRLTQNPAYTNAKRGQRRIIKTLSTEAIFSTVVSPWLNIPPPEKRSIKSGARNFPKELIEDSITKAADAGFASFEINFEGFSPTDIDGEARALIKETARRKNIKLELRLKDFSAYEEEEAARIALQEAVHFAADTGAKLITLRLRDLRPETTKLIAEEAQKASHEGIILSVENFLSTERTLSEKELNDAFEGTPVQFSVWFDFTPNVQSYVERVHLTVSNFYIGNRFWEPNSLGYYLEASRALRWIRERGWRGNVIIQSHINTIDMRRALLDKVIGLSYVSEKVAKSLFTGRIEDLLPTLVAAPVIREENTGTHLGTRGTYSNNPYFEDLTATFDDMHKQFVREYINAQETLIIKIENGVLTQINPHAPPDIPANILSKLQAHLSTNPLPAGKSFYMYLFKGTTKNKIYGRNPYALLDAEGEMLYAEAGSGGQSVGNSYRSIYMTQEFFSAMDDSMLADVLGEEAEHAIQKVDIGERVQERFEDDPMRTSKLEDANKLIARHRSILFSEMIQTSSYISSTSSAFLESSEDLGDKKGEIIVPEEYLDEFKDTLKNKKLGDVKIVTLEEAKTILCDREGSEKRIVLLKKEDMPDYLTDVAACRVFKLENYNFLHLCSTIGLARAVIAENTNYIKEFYSLLLGTSLKDDELKVLLESRIISLSLPPIDATLIKDIQVLRQTYAQILQSA